MLGQRQQRWPTLRLHWLNALCLLGGVTALRPNERAVHTSTLLLGVQCQLQLMLRSRVMRDVTELT